MLAEVNAGLSPLYEGCKRNRENWEKLQEEHDKLSKFISSLIKLFFSSCRFALILKKETKLFRQPCLISCSLLLK
jgi:hypothetical protein